MKTSGILLICVVLCCAIPALAQNKDVDAIKALLEKETKAFIEIDYKSWADTWAHTPYAFWSYADTTDVNSFSGWDKINSNFSSYFKTAKPSKAKIDREWHEIKVFGNGAYVRFTQHIEDDTIRPGQAQVRVLEKIKGQWKIVLVSVIAIEKETLPQL